MIPELDTPRLNLRIVHPSLAEAVAGYYRRNLEHLQPTSPTFPDGIGSAREWERRLEKNRDLARAGWEYRYFLLTEGEQRVIGTANLTEVARGPMQQCQLGFGLDALEQGRGLMREALERVIAFAFEELRLMKIRACHLQENRRSAHLLSKLGFEVEGLARKDICVAGHWRDHVLRSRLNPRPELVQT